MFKHPPEIIFNIYPFDFKVKKLFYFEKIPTIIIYLKILYHKFLGLYLKLVLRLLYSTLNHLLQSNSLLNTNHSRGVISITVQ